MKSMPQRYTEKEASEFLGISHVCLKKWRLAGRGPAFFRLGTRVIYSHEDLIAWMSSRRVESDPSQELATA